MRLLLTRRTLEVIFMFVARKHEHTRSDVSVGGRRSSEKNVQFDTGLHPTSLVVVATDETYSLGRHDEIGRQRREEVAVAGADSYCDELQGKFGMHTRSDVNVGAISSNSSGVQNVRGLQTVLRLRLQIELSNSLSEQREHCAQTAFCDPKQGLVKYWSCEHWLQARHTVSAADVQAVKTYCTEVQVLQLLHTVLLRGPHVLIIVFPNGQAVHSPQNRSLLGVAVIASYC